jgi:hypothetical protein
VVALTLTGTADGLSSGSGTLSVVGVQALEGAADGSSTATGTLNLEGTIQVGYTLVLNTRRNPWKPRRSTEFVFAPPDD